MGRRRERRGAGGNETGYDGSEEGEEQNSRTKVCSEILVPEDQQITRGCCLVTKWPALEAPSIPGLFSAAGDDRLEN